MWHQTSIDWIQVDGWWYAIKRDPSSSFLHGSFFGITHSPTTTTMASPAFVSACFLTLHATRTAGMLARGTLRVQAGMFIVSYVHPLSGASFPLTQITRPSTRYSSRETTHPYRYIAAYEFPFSYYQLAMPLRFFSGTHSTLRVDVALGTSAGWLDRRKHWCSKTMREGERERERKREGGKAASIFRRDKKNTW